MLSNLTPAYTQFFENFIEENYGDYEPGTSISYILYNHFQTAWEDNEFWSPETQHLQRLCDLIVDRFYMLEVWSLNVDNFDKSMTRIFDKHKDYYAELIGAYETEINFLDGNKVTRDHDNTSTTTPRATYKTENYDLPRSDQTTNRPSSKTISGGQDGTDSVRDQGQVIVKGGDVIELKRRYMNLLRNVYDEFAQKFESCFIGLCDYVMEEE